MLERDPTKGPDEPDDEDEDLGYRFELPEQHKKHIEQLARVFNGDMDKAFYLYRLLLETIHNRGQGQKELRALIQGWLKFKQTGDTPAATETRPDETQDAQVVNARGYELVKSMPRNGHHTDQNSELRMRGVRSIEEILEDVQSLARSLGAPAQKSTGLNSRTKELHECFERIEMGIVEARGELGDWGD